MNKELARFFKEMFYIDVMSDEVESIDFPTFEEVLGVLDLADLKKESFRHYKSEIFNDKNISVDYIRQCMIMLTACALNNAGKVSNNYHNLLVSKLIEENLIENTTFISANYDINIDNAIASLYHENEFPYMLDYGIDFSNFNIKDNNWLPPKMPKINLYKIHGSLNWLYCPICSSITLTPYEGGVLRIIENIRQAKCLNCGELTVPIIVPPTYFKNMSNFYLSTVWNKSEKALRDSDVLVLCGYSFPEADMHIKYLLKRVQSIRKQKKLKILIVNNHENKKDTIKEKEKNRYERFLGKDVIYTDYSFEDFVKDPLLIINKTS